MQVVKAKRAIGPIKNGCTRPYYLLCDDGDVYAVKFKQNPEGTRILVNEYVCARIAQMLDLPLATPRLIEITDEFIGSYGNKIAAHVEDTILSGWHFGTKKIKKVYPITNSEMLKVAKNVSIIPEIILFDQLICNRDRDDNGGNLLFDSLNRSIVIIDHTHAFDLGPIWSDIDLRQRMGEPFIPFNTDGYVFNKLIQFVNGNNPFYKILDKMKRLNKENLGEIITSIPNEWDVDEQDRLALLDYIYDRLIRIEQALHVLEPIFPYWKGGNIL